jgi:hypothetical protein
MAGWSGLLNLPSCFWIWWGIEQPFYYIPGGPVLDQLGEKQALQG